MVLVVKTRRVDMIWKVAGLGLLVLVSAAGLWLLPQLAAPHAPAAVKGTMQAAVLGCGAIAAAVWSAWRLKPGRGRP
jgi:hypothetical protein